jgi:hypothetical protein
MKAKLLFAMAAASLPLLSSAQSEVLENVLDKLPFDISGSVDAYVQTNFTPKATSDVANESFSYNANSFNLGMANLMLSKQIGKVGFMVDLGFGPRAVAANGSDYSAIKQLYVSYAPAEWVELTFGTFSTFFGYELIEPTNNFQYSTSLAFQNGPFFHTGLKANFTKDKFNFLVAVMNPTDTKEVFERRKFVGAQLGYSGDNGGVFLNYVGGSQVGPDDDGLANAFRHSLDLTGSIGVGAEKGGLIGVNAALHYESGTLTDGEVEEDYKAKYFTAYLYAQGDLSEKFAVGGRLGYFGDYDGLVGLGTKAHFDATVNAKVTIGPLALIPEVRVKYAKDEIYIDNKSTGSKIQPTMLLAAVISF